MLAKGLVIWKQYQRRYHLAFCRLPTDFPTDHTDLKSNDFRIDIIYTFKLFRAVEVKSVPMVGGCSTNR